MNKWKSTLATMLGFFAIAGAVSFSSCEQDPCLDLLCQNSAACINGHCQCATGYEGAECDITAASRFVGSYEGMVRCGDYPAKVDTVLIELVSEPDQILIKLGFGNTALLSFSGTAKTPESHFMTRVNEDVEVHAYLTVDGDLLNIYLETIDKSIDYRQVCKFTGRRIRPETE